MAEEPGSDSTLLEFEGEHSRAPDRVRGENSANC
jgi:hypothetical protein